jgi:hypothetical protein
MNHHHKREINHMKTKSEVANYVARSIHLSGKSNIQIAAEAGFPNPNVLSMITKGDTKVPAVDHSCAPACSAKWIHRLSLPMG